MRMAQILETTQNTPCNYDVNAPAGNFVTMAGVRPDTPDRVSLHDLL